MGNGTGAASKATSKDGKRTCEGVPKLSKWGGAGRLNFGSHSSPCDCILVIDGLPSVHCSLQPALEKVLFTMFSEIAPLNNVAHSSSVHLPSDRHMKKIKKEFQTLKLSEDGEGGVALASPKNKRPKVDDFDNSTEESSNDNEEGSGNDMPVPVCVPVDQQTGTTMGFAYVQFESVFDAALAAQVADGFRLTSRHHLECKRFSSLLQQQMYALPISPISLLILQTVEPVVFLPLHHHLNMQVRESSKPDGKDTPAHPPHCSGQQPALC